MSWARGMPVTRLTLHHVPTERLQLLGLVVRAEDGVFLGEAVLNEVDLENGSANYRVWLAGPQVFGQDYVTEVTELVVDYALGTCGLHRVSLGVYDFNPRAQRVYEKCGGGFRLEGRLRHALRWEGRWHDELLMAVLSTDPWPTN